MTKHEEALLALAKAKIAATEANKKIADALAASANAAVESGEKWPEQGTKNHWLELAYERTHNHYDGVYYSNHDDDIEGFLAEHCQHALLAHQLIQERKPLRKALGIAKARVTRLGNQLLKQLQ